MAVTRWETTQTVESAPTTAITRTEQAAPPIRPIAVRVLRSGVGVAATLLALGIRLLLVPYLGDDAPLLVFTLAVMVSASVGGATQGLIATGLSTLVGVYFFTPPLYTLKFGSPREAEESVLFLVVGVLLTYLADALRLARQRAEQAQAQLADAYARERRITDALQDALLLLPEPNAFPGLQFHGIYSAARTEARVGGDLYDAFAVDEGHRVALVVGDVSGKGLVAAARTVEAKTALRAYLSEDPDPAVALTRLNRYLTGRLGDESGAAMFVALVVAVLDRQTGAGQVALAGEEPPLILRADGATEPLDGGGCPVGLFESMTYENVPLRLSDNDVLLLFTDGLTEARCGKRFFGPEGIAQAASRILQAEDAAPVPLSVLGDGIVGAARSFAHDNLHDDVCLLLARREPDLQTA
jgi:serine phosphatase RsbU (regulator of sigma subunit)